MHLTKLMHTWDNMSQLLYTCAEQCQHKQDVVMCSGTCTRTYTYILLFTSTQAGTAIHVHVGVHNLLPHPLMFETSKVNKTGAAFT